MAPLFLLLELAVTESLFTRIVGGEIPSHKVWEDEHTYAFLDIGPLSSGHTLVIPRECYPTLDEVPDEVAAALGVAIKKVGAAVAKVTGCEGWNVLQNNGAVSGQEVMHVHFHIIPRAPADGLGYRWQPGPLDTEAATLLRARLALALQG